MRLAILSLVMCFVSLVRAEDPPPASKTVFLHLGFEEGLGCVKWTNALVMTEKPGPDFSLFVIHPKIDQPPWILTIYSGNFPNPLNPMPNRKREWWPFSHLTQLHIRSNADGSVLAESIVPSGRGGLEVDPINGTFKRTGPIQQIHIMLWVARESDLEPTVTSLEFTKVPFPKK